MCERMRSPWAAFFTLLLLFVGGLAFNMFWTHRVNRESDRKWCDLVSTLDQAYRQAPPQTETGRRVAEGIARLRQNLDC